MGGPARALLFTVAGGLCIAGVGAEPPAAIAQAAAQTAAPAQLPRGSGLILGQVVDSNGAGVSGAVVTLGGGITQLGGYTFMPAPLTGGPRRTLTTADGRFLFAELPAGRYSLDATKAGYLPGAYGRRRPGANAQTLTLTDGLLTDAVKVIIFEVGAISGTVTDERGEPVVGATLQALRRVHEPTTRGFAIASTTTTDDRGWYRLSSLQAGDYLIAMPATTGTVPLSIQDAYMQAMQNGPTQEVMREFSGAFGLLAPTGQRLGDLIWQATGPRSAVPPGPDAEGRLFVYPATFHPSTTSPRTAEIVTLEAGEDRLGVNLGLALVSTGRITGRVTGPKGPATRVALRLMAEHAGEFASGLFDVATALSDDEGRFTFLAVPFGNYTIRALIVPPLPPASPPSAGPPARRVPTESTLWAEMPVTVGREARDVPIELQEGFRISGRFEFEGTLPKPAPNVVGTMNVMMQPVNGRASAIPLTGIVSPTGEISTYSIPPGQYVIRMSMPVSSWLATEGWHYVSSMLDGRDVGDTAFDLRRDVSGLVIRMSDRFSVISGVANGESGRIDQDAAVIVFSVDRSTWANFGSTPRRLRYVRVEPDATYRVTALPPGDYYVAAIPDEQAGNWLDPARLERLARVATRVTLGDGEQKIQNVTTRSIR